MSLPAFLLSKFILFAKFLYYIPDENKYKRKAERAHLILKKEKSCMRVPTQDLEIKY